MPTDTYSIFVHIPKTAGNAILSTLSDVPVVATPHGPLQRAISTVGDKIPWIPDAWDTLFKFSFVRNPWDRMVSMYYHSAKRDTTGWPIERHYEDFRDWLTYDGVRLLSTTTPGIALCDWQGHSNQIDFIGKYECLVEDVSYVAEKIGSEATKLIISNPGKNRPKAREWQPYYDTRTRTIIAGISVWEIKTFGYSFYDEPTPAPTERPLLTNKALLA